MSFAASGKIVSSVKNQSAASLGSHPRCEPHFLQRSSAECGPLPARTIAKFSQHGFCRSTFRSSLNTTPCSGDILGLVNSSSCMIVLRKRTDEATHHDCAVVEYSALLAYEPSQARKRVVQLVNGSFPDTIVRFLVLELLDDVEELDPPLTLAVRVLR